MARMIYINLPVADLQKSKDFFTALGFTLNPQFSDEQTACVVIDENIVAMVMTEERFAGFLHSPRAASGSTEVLLALSASSREECDDLKGKALANGGSEYGPAVDQGFMYGTSFRDPDGHVWEVTWMDPAALQG